MIAVVPDRRVVACMCARMRIVPYAVASCCLLGLSASAVPTSRSEPALELSTGTAAVAATDRHLCATGKDGTARCRRRRCRYKFESNVIVWLCSVYRFHAYNAATLVLNTGRLLLRFVLAVFGAVVVWWRRPTPMFAGLWSASGFYFRLQFGSPLTWLHLDAVW